MTSLYPINLDIENKKVSIIGGGEVALRKVKTLLSFKAKVYVVSPKVIPAFEDLAGKGEVILHREKYNKGFLRESFLVIGATDDPQVNRIVARDAEEENIPVNIVDDLELCTFLVPAVVKRGPLTISISTGGESPGMSAKIRRDLEKIYGKKYGLFLEYLGKVRKILIKEIPDPEKRRELIIKLSDPSLVSLIEGEDLSRLEDKCREIIKDYLEK